MWARSSTRSRAAPSTWWTPPSWTARSCPRRTRCRTAPSPTPCRSAEQRQGGLGHLVHLLGRHRRPQRQPYEPLGRRVGDRQRARRTSVASPRRGAVERHVVEHRVHPPLGEPGDQVVARGSVLQQQVVHVAVVLALGGYHGAAGLAAALELLEALVIGGPDLEPPACDLLGTLELGPQEG